MLSSASPSFIVLLVSHNRRALTVRCVEALLSEGGVSRRIVLFDDASSDGTVQSVLELAPETIVVRGEGAAFWNGGLYRAWMRALPEPCDAFVWLNDDVVLKPGALASVAAEYRAAQLRLGTDEFVLAGAVEDSAGRASYGGYRRVRSLWALRFEPVPPCETAIPIDTFNGNFVVVPRAVTQRIGVNDPVFFHNMGDIDYGLRAKRAGIPVLLLPGFVGECEANAAKADRGYGAPGLSLGDQWKAVGGRHGLPFKSWLRLTWRHSGVWFPLHVLLPYRRLAAPRGLLNFRLGGPKRGRKELGAAAVAQDVERGAAPEHRIDGH